MTKEELKEYLINNLRIQTYTDCNGSPYVELLLEGKRISEDTIVQDYSGER